jgi:transaldolase
MAMSTPLHQLADHGQSVWIDFLSRELLRGGELARMMREDAASPRTRPSSSRRSPLAMPTTISFAA